MAAHSSIAEGTILWEPSATTRESSRLAGYLRWLEASRGQAFADYAAAWRWSVEDLDGFWASIVEHFELPIRGSWERVLADRRMPGARWFEGATLNHAEAILRRATPDRPALLARSERRPLRRIGWDELTADVAAAAAGLRRLGVGRGDRVAAVLPNIPEAVVGLLATASIGAIWSSSAPEFGAQSIIDRFAQIEPRVLLAVDGYSYGGVAYDRRPVIADLAAALPSVETIGLLPDLDPSASLPMDRRRWLTWAELLGGPTDSLAIEPVPFDHPLWILYSSGTTGLPKPIVHGHGGVVLEHAKELALQMDVREGDPVFWYTTTGWMMWNFIVGAMLVGGVPVLYDGSPLHPDPMALWDLAAETRASLMGLSAAYLSGCRKLGLSPGADRDLSALRCIGSTGSPLSVDGFGWVYEAVRSDVWLASISGGTDVVTAFVGGSPTLPVRAGELQCRALGARVEAFDGAGRSVVGETGELVVTAPLPSMPVGFWGDTDGSRYRDSYFDVYPGVWRHGDWIRITESGGAVIEGRSDSTLNRGGIRFGTAELYRVMEGLPEIADSLVIGLELPDGGYWMPLFVALAPGAELDDELRSRIRAAIRRDLSPRHVPDEILVVSAVPRTLTGKKMEVPVKRLFLGRPVGEVAAPGAMADPTALEPFLALARERGLRSDSPEE